MNFLSRQAFTVLAVLIALGSVGYNIAQKQQIDRLTVVKELSYQKDTLLTDGYNEQILARLNDIKQNQIELARNQGKVEGMVLAIQNIKPEDNLTSDLWHNGYYRGLAQIEDVAQAKYAEGYHKATSDGACPITIKSVAGGEGVSPTETKNDGS